MRIIAIVMAALMIIGMAYYIIVTLAAPSGASDVPTATEVIDTSSLKNSGDVLVSVGLMYGSNITTGFECATEHGYVVGAQDLDGDRSFTPLWTLYETTVACTADANLSVNDRTYTVAYYPEDTDVGGYHVEINCRDCDERELANLIDERAARASRYGYTLIPCWIGGGYRIRMGSFADWDGAWAAAEDAADLFPDRRITVAEPTETAVSLIEPYENRILFEYDCGGESELGLEARTDQNGNTYIRTPAGNVYDGVFCFRRYDNGTVDGVSLINVVPLETYVAGVLPYELAPYWPVETLKAFAITVRSFTLTNPKKHAAHHFDLCGEVDCQVYRGAGRINQNVLDAVLDTAGIVMTYDGRIVAAYYSSSVGGCTVNAMDAWGGTTDIPYLQAKETPWENYMEHDNAFWINEISPVALCDRLNRAGFTELTDAIDSVEVLGYAENSTYVKHMRVTDIYGTSVTFDTTDEVRAALTPYVKSANFVIGKGSAAYTETYVTDPGTPAERPSPDAVDANDTPGSSGASAAEPPARQAPLKNYDIDYGYTNLGEYHVITSDAIRTGAFDGSVRLITADGVLDCERHSVFTISSQTAAAFLGDEYRLPEEEAAPAQQEPVRQENPEFTAAAPEPEPVRIDVDTVTTQKIAYADNPENFIVVGKGWGHGVGMSQWGAYDLALRGFTATEILDAYFTGIRYRDYRELDGYR